MKHLTYLISILMICVPTLLIIWKKQKRILRKHEMLLLIVSLLGLPFAGAEWLALHWKAWEYGSETTLHVHVGAEIETYLFSAGIFACVAAVTIVRVIQTDRLNERAKRQNKTKKLVKTRPKLKTAHAAIRKAV